MRRALISGVGGQDGSYLAEQLVELGWEVHGISRNVDSGHEPGNENIIHHYSDLEEFESIRGIISSTEPDVIFNLAGISSVAYSWKNPVQTAQINSTAAINMLDHALVLQNKLGKDIRFIQASSAEIFGNAHISPQTESTPLAPISPYGAAKAFTHSMVSAYRSRGLAASSAILYNHESPRRPETFVTRKISLGVARIAIGLSDSLILGNLEVRRDWGWAPDFADALYRMAVSDKADDYIVATGESHSLREFVRSAFLAAGISEWERYVKTDQQFVRPADASDMRGNPKKAMTDLNWTTTVSFSEIVRQMVQADLMLLQQKTNNRIDEME